MRLLPVLPISLTIALLPLLAHAGDGLALPRNPALWPQWQARVTASGSQLAPVSLFDRPEAARTAPPAVSLFGDYYFDAPGLRLPATVGGIRATSGLLGGVNRTANQPLGESQPYFGVGYTGLAAKGGWGFTADLGLALGNTTGRPIFGTQGLDTALRDLRLSPVLQVGVRYAF